MPSFIRRSIMELKQFIASSLTQIIQGIKEAQNNSSELKAKVVPRITATRMSTVDSYLVDPDSNEPIYHVKFNVAVTIGEESGKEGGVGIFVGPVSLGVKGKKAETSEASNRIEFEVPVRYPTQT